MVSGKGRWFGREPGDGDAGETVLIASWIAKQLTSDREPVLVDLALQGEGSYGTFTRGVLDWFLGEAWLRIRDNTVSLHSPQVGVQKARR